MLHKIAACVLFLFFLAACEPKLERENIPLWLGIQLDIDTPCPEESWQANQQLQQSYSPAGWIMEIPLFIPKHDNLAFRQPDTVSIISAYQRVKNMCPQVAIHFSLQNPFSIIEAELTTARYIQFVEAHLRQLPSPPSMLVFSGFWIQDTTFRKALLQQFPRWQDAFPQSPIYIAARAPLLLSPSFSWQENHGIALINDAPPNEDFKPHFREVNKALSAKALKFNKKIFIAQTNVLGEHKLLLYKNQLRFWDKSVVLEGLTINSLYCRSSLTDSTTRFGAAKDQAFLQYVKESR